VKSEHESIIYEYLFAPGNFCDLHDSNLTNWLADVLFRLIYRGSQRQKELKGSWYNTCSVTLHLRLYSEEVANLSSTEIDLKISC